MLTHDSIPSETIRQLSLQTNRLKFGVLNKDGRTAIKPPPAFTGSVLHDLKPLVHNLPAFVKDTD